MNVVPASAGTASNLVELRSIAVSPFPRSSVLIRCAPSSADVPA
jgi:hypothetical protein